MNRKLLNGLLVLTVAASGVGTFTSCKDEDFRNDLALNQTSLQAQIDAIRSISDEQFRQNLKDLFDTWVKVIQGPAGKDGVTPKFELRDGDLWVSYDDGKTWNNLGKVAGSNGQSGVTPTFELRDGDLWVSYDNGKTWSNLGNVTGENGMAGKTPQFKLEDGDLWVSYDNGETWQNLGKVAGNPGSSGDVVTPLFKLEDGDLWVSYDNGETWQNLGPVSGSGSSFTPDEWLAMANEWTGLFATEDWGYQEMVQSLSQLYQLYQDVLDRDYTEAYGYVNGLYDMMFNHIFPEADWFKDLQGNNAWMKNVLERASSVGISAVFNPVFGNINLPVGINSTILATYVYSSTEGDYNFPSEAFMHFAKASAVQNLSANAELFNVIAELAGEGVDLGAVAFTDATNFGNMGGAVVTINPASVDFKNPNYVVELVNSKLETKLTSANGDLVLGEYDKELTFGASRAAAPAGTGVYKLSANASQSNYGSLQIDIEKEEVKSAVKQIIDERSLSSVTHLGETLFKAVNNKLPAYAVKVSWTEDVPETDVNGGYVLDENNNAVTTPTTNYVLSDFRVAATVVQPLSYGTNISHFTAGHTPLPVVHSKLSDKIGELQKRMNNALASVFDTIAGVDNYEFNLKMNGSGKIEIWGQEGSEFEGQLLATLTYSEQGIEEAENGTFEYFLKKFFESQNQELNEVVNNQIIHDINNAIESINDELKWAKSKLGRVNDYIDKVKDSRELELAQKLVDVYNELAGKANDFLENANHYLQVAMAYSDGNGAHHMSNDMYYPETFEKPSNGNTGVNLYITSYTGDVVVPSYKKFVAITGVKQADGTYSTSNLASVNQKAFGEDALQVLPGNRETLPMDVTDLAGKTVRITYVSVDYRGMCSMENYYMSVAE